MYGRITELLSSGLAYDLFRHNASCAPARVSIKHIRGTAADVLPTLSSGQFHIVYVDASHYYDAVKADLIAAQRLVAPGGILAGDDLELQIGAGVDEASARAVIDHDYIRAPSGVPYHPGVAIAVAEVLGRVSSIGRAWFMRRHADGFVPIDLQAEGARMIVPGHWPNEYKASAREFLAGGG